MREGGLKDQAHKFSQLSSVVCLHNRAEEEDGERRRFMHIRLNQWLMKIGPQFLFDGSSRNKNVTRRQVSYSAWAQFLSSHAAQRDAAGHEEEKGIVGFSQSKMEKLQTNLSVFRRKQTNEAISFKTEQK